MEPIKILVCENDYTWIGKKKLILEEFFASINVSVDITYCNDYEQIFDHIEMAILDLDLGKSFADGAAYARKISEKNPHVAMILITCLDGYFPELGKIPLSGFLCKPIFEAEAEYILNRAVQDVNRYRVWNANEQVIIFPKEKITISEKNIISILKVRGKHELKVFTADKQVQIQGGIKELERNLSDYFIRLNRSVIVNVSNMYYMDKNTVRMKTGLIYKVSILNRKKVNAAYRAYNAKRLV